MNKWSFPTDLISILRSHCFHASSQGYGIAFEYELESRNEVEKLDYFSKCNLPCPRFQAFKTLKEEREMRLGKKTPAKHSYLGQVLKFT